MMPIIKNVHLEAFNPGYSCTSLLKHILCSSSAFDNQGHGSLIVDTSIGKKIKCNKSTTPKINN